MRQWLREVYTTFPSEPDVERVRSRVQIDTQTTSIIHGNGDKFRVRIYNPIVEDGRILSALLMFHGGGWIHGFPEMDEGNCRRTVSDTVPTDM